MAKRLDPAVKAARKAGRAKARAFIKSMEERVYEVHWVEVDCRGRTSGFVEQDMTKGAAERYADYLRDIGAVQVEVSRRGV